MFYELMQFIIYSGLIVVISKYVLVSNLRKLAENLNLKAKTVGDIAGAATSVPEFLTIIISSIKGMISTSLYNILSSNIINFIQYMASIIINKNRRAFENLFDISNFNNYNTNYFITFKNRNEFIYNTNIYFTIYVIYINK